MIDNLKDLYSRITDKKKFIKLCSDDFKLPEHSIRSNWFSTWRVPEAKQERLHTLMINYLRQQIKSNSKRVEL